METMADEELYSHDSKHSVAQQEREQKSGQNGN